MQRRFSYALAAALLSSGTPHGVPGVALARPILLVMLGYFLGRRTDQFAQLSETDGLTRLLNGRGFAARLHAEIKRAKRYQQPVSLLFLDLDGLKRINDRYGHRAGSQALRQVAGIIRSQLREPDLGARWGGDEFTILAPNTGNEAAMVFAERLRSCIAAHVSDWPITASIGVATLEGKETTEPADAHALMRDADAAMYEAKRRGKNTVVAAKKSGAAEAAPLCLANP